ncbi:MAG: hypothetical protein CMF46_01455 [Legionellales bacterium]|nr:hypothetical protein [Legionellales bacterium]
MNIEKSTMLINAAWSSNSEETRLAVVSESGKLINLEIDNKMSNTHNKRMKGNIYVGEIVDIQQHLEAAFIRYSNEDARHGFLPFKEICPNYLADSDNPETATVAERLKVGERLLVQITKDERGTKGAALTTYISIPGTYLVLMPQSHNSNGISKRVDPNDRDAMKNMLNSLDKPEHMSIILRTAAIGKGQDELQWDLSNLLNHWEAIRESGIKEPLQTLLHAESSPILRGMRDLLRKNIDSIVVDDEKTYNEVKAYAEMTRPEYANLVKLHTQKLPIFSHYQIEKSIEDLLKREVDLPSGGRVCIDKTEALTACDVNSARSTKGSDIEATAFATNLEAAAAVAEHIRLRDIGGIIAIDFIDMSNKQNKAKVEQAFVAATELDLARVKVVPICSTTGCMLLIRQKMGSTIFESITTEQIRTIESRCSSTLRLIEYTIAGISNIDNIQVQLSTKAATFILNEKRQLIQDLEEKYKTTIYIIPNQNFSDDEHQIKTLKAQGTGPSYKQLTHSNKPLYQPSEKRAQRQTPAVERSYTQQHPNSGPGIFQKIASWFQSKPAETKVSSKNRHAKSNSNDQRRRPLDNRNPNRTSSSRRQGNQMNNKSATNHSSRRRRSPVSRGKPRSDSEQTISQSEIDS